MPMAPAIRAASHPCATPSAVHPSIVMGTRDAPPATEGGGLASVPIAIASATAAGDNVPLLTKHPARAMTARSSRTFPGHE